MKRTEVTYNVEAVHVGFFNPPFKLVRDMFWCPNDSGTQTADRDVLGDRELRPLRHAWCRL